MIPTQRKELPGLWASRFNARNISSELRFSDVLWDSDSNTLIWREERSERGVLVCHAIEDDHTYDLTTGLSVRAHVGYGGGDFTIAHGYAYFASEGRLFRQHLKRGQAQGITPVDSGQYASPAVSPNGQHVIYVRSHRETDVLALVDTEGKDVPRTLVQGNDFFMQPCWHPNGNQIAWIAWDHPSMPWDSTALCLGKLDLSQNLPYLSTQQILSGELHGDTAIFQPAFSPDGCYLSYISNENGWFNVHLYDLNTRENHVLVAEKAEHGLPAWVHNMRTQAWSEDGTSLYFLRYRKGFASLARFDLHSQKVHNIRGKITNYTDLTQITSNCQGELALIASSPSIPTRIISVSNSVQISVHRHSDQENIEEIYFSRPEPLSWPTNNNSGAPQQCHGLYYPPCNPQYKCTALPPTIVKIHGGPTSQYRAGYHAETQFFTSRGFAVLELNYRGSSGYGKHYTDILKSNWGVVDVEDTRSAVQHLLAQGLVDGRQVAIMGGSAGGFTVLLSLISNPGLFQVGVCRYAVSDLFTLTEDTHKFEQHYLDSLVGKLPEHEDLYRQRSPMFSAESIEDPVAIFQGDEDKVVPRSQSDKIVESLIKRGVPHLYQIYPGEGHGWRKRETIQDYYEKTEQFLRQYMVSPQK
ncbi:MAG: S9 family peptidase [Acidobacteriota bacterium]|nr:S9 family peptidase [Acidobacteriota bacterium]